MYHYLHETHLNHVPLFWKMFGIKIAYVINILLSEFAFVHVNFKYHPKIINNS